MSVELPAGLEIVEISPHGASYWTRTAEITTRQNDGQQLSFFLKVSDVSATRFELKQYEIPGLSR